MKISSAVLIVGLLVYPTVHGTAPSDQTAREAVEVGGRVIRIPAPPAFERVDGVDAGVDRLMASMLPATNRYLARFEPLKNHDGDAGRSFNAQVLRQLEGQEIGTRALGEVKSQMKEEFGKQQEAIREAIDRLSGDAEKSLQDAAGTDAALKISDVAFLGFFDDYPDSLGFTMAMNVAAQAGAFATSDKGVVAGMIVSVNGRMIYLYANADFKSEADRNWAEEAVSAWRNAVVAANPRVEGPSSRFPLLNGVGRSAMVGAVIGGLVGLLSWMFRKRRQKT